MYSSSLSVNHKQHLLATHCTNLLAPLILLYSQSVSHLYLFVYLFIFVWRKHATCPIECHIRMSHMVRFLSLHVSLSTAMWQTSL